MSFSWGGGEFQRLTHTRERAVTVNDSLKLIQKHKEENAGTTL